MKTSTKTDEMLIEVSKFRNVFVTKKNQDSLLSLELESLDFLIEQLTWKEGYETSKAILAVEEYRKWISLIVISRDKLFIETYMGCSVTNLGMPSMHIDNVWHRHITFTKEYPKFCSRVHGEMIHHNPCTRANISSMNASVTEQLYRIIYGELPSIWFEKERFLQIESERTQDENISMSAECEYILSAECEYILAAECEYIL